ncbi:MAG: OadG family transporter subunit [Porphyromonas sp.]|nr:OadG family transporter subunit [Porphyromonas sp.]
MYNASAKRNRHAGLLLAVALPLGLQAENLSRSAQLQQTDPNGLILTMTAVFVVFLALVLLVVVFKAIGRGLLALSTPKTQAPECAQPTTTTTTSAQDNEVAVAISMALNSYRKMPSQEAMAAIALSIEDYCSNLHDFESYRLTIRPKATQWNARVQNLRKYPK